MASADLPQSLQQAGRSRTEIGRRGVMLVLSSPSGAGKGTLSRLLLDTDRQIVLSVSVTTRERRQSEVNGVHYHFISVPEFESLRDRNGLLEWAEVHGNYYGTPLAPVERAIAAGRDVLFDIDWQGAVQLIDRMPDDVATIFILPPTMAELRLRLQRRAEDAPEVIEKRLKNSSREMAEWKRFDYVIVNDDLDGAFADVSAILRAERLKRARRTGIGRFIEGLTG
ncbi:MULTISPECIES: guanylate kinase [Prosthecodimorpha]|jgi:guanylate kinase|uniref:Guanylate kinase n=2 Tax=Prosthecodimorpha TaxID=2981530 RepID=A0A0P6W6X8_9HYPH|nr:MULTISPECIES: guanylate kinase [Hyphomicrobiales]KPL54885.1 guanylate kinase [Prosthecomicrobium hirschii]MBT9290102.1 guanylate kinase [Prosthecodimorpha staleyi]TPQ52415.1 guanylate kinase [Prosthecomicrobium hirschii]